MERFTVTLAALRKERACVSGYNRLVRTLQGKPFTDEDEERKTHLRFSYKAPIKITTILESNGFQDALWSLRCVKDVDRDFRLYAIWCARQVLEPELDPRSVNSLIVATLYAEGEATYEELREANTKANHAAWEMREKEGAWNAARAIARATDVHAAWLVAWDTARYSAQAATANAIRVSMTPGQSAEVYYATVDAQKEMLTKMCNGQAPWQTEGTF